MAYLLTQPTLEHIATLLKTRPRFRMPGAKPHFRIPLQPVEDVSNNLPLTAPVDHLTHQDKSKSLYIKKKSGNVFFASLDEPFEDPTNGILISASNSSEFVKKAQGAIGNTTALPRHAAVLVPLCYDNSVPSVLFIRRARTMRHHKGQVAFPGGMFEPDDLFDARTCALRETFEEIGISPDHFTILGAHHDASTSEIKSNQGTVVTPVIAMLKRDINDVKLSLQHAELDLAFCVPLQLLCDANNWESFFARPSLHFEVGVGYSVERSRAVRASRRTLYLEDLKRLLKNRSLSDQAYQRVTEEMKEIQQWDEQSWVEWETGNRLSLRKKNNEDLLIHNEDESKMNEKSLNSFDPLTFSRQDTRRLIEQFRDAYETVTHLDATIEMTEMSDRECDEFILSHDPPSSSSETNKHSRDMTHMRQSLMYPLARQPPGNTGRHQAVLQSSVYNAHELGGLLPATIKSKLALDSNTYHSKALSSSSSQLQETKQSGGEVKTKAAETVMGTIHEIFSKNQITLIRRSIDVQDQTTTNFQDTTHLSNFSKGATTLNEFLSKDVEIMKGHVPFYVTSSGVCSNKAIQQKMNSILRDTLATPTLVENLHGNDVESSEDLKSLETSETNADFSAKVHIWGLSAWMLHIFLKQIVVDGDFSPKKSPTHHQSSSSLTSKL